MNRELDSGPDDTTSAGRTRWASSRTSRTTRLPRPPRHDRLKRVTPVPLASRPSGIIPFSRRETSRTRSHQPGEQPLMTTLDTSSPDVADPPRGSDFARLSRQIRQAGLLDRRRGYYLARMTINGLLLAAGGLAFALLGDSWWQLLIATFLAVVFTQFAFIGHDAGHKQIFRSRRRNDLVGYLHGGITGISYQWWVGKHNQHH